ncbi:5'/3'-nucleotidase SurE [Christensenella tenuis]|uniref:5'-nucleotidase SurE n=1 Tax=Christensenella tenuis TaxID=2763033 RepID=A0ABR7EBQ9_9FIRM|nr:5'/3'-nucleotidase SurE [Christensenella tenuis]MBC5647195.1 5'/3'-nucleotidase SurE [Christensenella tenuis]
MNILITNDDGIYAQGIRALTRAMAQTGHEITVVAPDSQKSACSHALTMDTPLTVKEIEEFGVKAYAVSGTPADCVKLGLAHLLEDKIDLVISGINSGANLGSDIAYSGTVNAALEANMLHVPAVAFSKALVWGQGKAETNFDEVADLAAELIGQLEIRILKKFIYNINFPAVPRNSMKGVKFCKQGISAYDEAYDRRTDPFGRDYFWISGRMIEDEYNEEHETDIKWNREGYITVTPLKWNQTDETEIHSSKCKIEQIKLHF